MIYGRVNAFKLKQKGDIIVGIVSNIPKHFRTGNEAVPEIKDLLLDIGASSDEEVRELGIEIGDTIVPNTELTQLSEYRYSAKAWDNRYGCVIAIEILELLSDVELMSIYMLVLTSKKK